MMGLTRVSDLSEAALTPTLSGREKIAATWWPYIWPPLLLSALVLLALGQFLQVGLVSTDWWPVVSTNRVENMSDFVRAFQASAEMGQWTLLAQTVREWKATAAVHADPELVEQLTSPLSDDFGEVHDPTEH